MKTKRRSRGPRLKTVLDSRRNLKSFQTVPVSSRSLEITVHCWWEVKSVWMWNDASRDLVRVPFIRRVGDRLKNPLGTKLEIIKSGRQDPEKMHRCSFVLEVVVGNRSGRIMSEGE